MKTNNKYLIKTVIAALLSVALLFSLTACSGGGDSGAKNGPVVYDDMKQALDSSGIMSSNIGLFTRTEENGNVSYGNGGSGVIFRRDGDSYYALTAAHVVSGDNAEFLVFTVNTEMTTEAIPGIGSTVVFTQESYERMYTAEVLYVSDRDDLAVIRFECAEDLAAARLADADPVKGDRILCVGNPQNELFGISCGEVISGLETFGETKGYPSRVLKHTAFIEVGSSGGAAFTEDMRIAGITPGASFSLDNSFNFGVMIPVSEINYCLAEWGADS